MISPVLLFATALWRSASRWWPPLCDGWGGVGPPPLRNLICESPLAVQDH